MKYISIFCNQYILCIIYFNKKSIFNILDININTIFNNIYLKTKNHKKFKYSIFKNQSIC